MVQKTRHRYEVLGTWLLRDEDHVTVIYTYSIPVSEEVPSSRENFHIQNLTGAYLKERVISHCDFIIK